METNQIKENTRKVILQFSIPSILAMLLQTVITITDGYFTGNYVGESALAAINLGLPILYFYLGVGLCVGVGGSVISSRFLGEGSTEKASKVFSQTMVTAVVIGMLVTAAVSVLFTPILTVLGAEGELSAYFTEYYRIMQFTYVLMILGTILGMFIRADGKPQICMLVSFGGCILNVVLDYVFVAALGQGVRGSAIASLITQVLTVIVQIGYFVGRKAVMRFCRFTFDWEISRETMLNGASEFIGEMASAISTFTFNYVLMKYAGADGVAAFTIMGFAVYGYSMICIGFGQGISPLVAICWGAKELETAMRVRRITNRILFVLGMITAGAFVIMGRDYAGIFGCSAGVTDMVAGGCRVYAVTFLVMGYDVIASMYFTSCGDAKASALISALRGIVLLLAFTLLLPVFLGVNGVWLASPCTELLTAAVSLMLIRRQTKIILQGQTQNA